MPTISPSGLHDISYSPQPFVEWDKQSDQVLIENTQSISALTPHFAQLKVIVVAFPNIGDGRGFSTAKALRDAGFEGQIIAQGEMTPDQYPMALLCGYNAVEISQARLDRQPIEHWQAVDQVHLWRERLQAQKKNITQAA